MNTGFAETPDPNPESNNRNRTLTAAAKDDVSPADVQAKVLRLRRIRRRLFVLAAVLVSVIWIFIGVVFVLSKFGERIAVSDSFLTLFSELDFSLALVAAFLPALVWIAAIIIRRIIAARLKARLRARFPPPQTWTVDSGGDVVRGAPNSRWQGIFSPILGAVVIATFLAVSAGLYSLVGGAGGGGTGNDGADDESRRRADSGPSLDLDLADDDRDEEHRKDMRRIVIKGDGKPYFPPRQSVNMRANTTVLVKQGGRR